MRTVSFFGPKEGGIEGGRTGADNGRVATGGFGDGKKLVDEISSGADCGEEGTGALPVSRTGNWIRTVSRGLTLGAAGWRRRYRRMRHLDANRLFFGWSGSAIAVGEIDQKSPTCHYPILQRRKM